MTDHFKECVRITDTQLHTFTIERIADDPFLQLSKKVHDYLPKRLYEPKKNDKIYFVPGCDIPRFKVKKFCEEFNVSIVKYQDKANILFIGPDSILEYFTGIHFGYVTSHDKNQLIGILETKQPAHSTELLKALKTSLSKYVLINSQDSSQIKNIKYGMSDLDYTTRPKLMIKDEEHYQHLVNMQNDERYYDQQELLRRINTGNVMNEEIYNSIKRMLKSTDSGNVTLAMETMANCDYEKSALYLLLLLKEFRDVFFISKTKNHVNFKSLLKFFNIQNISGFNLYDILAALLHTKLLNQTTLDKLLPDVNDSIQAHRYFEIKEFGYSEEILKGLSENILDINCDTEIVDEPQEVITFKNYTFN